ncbi:hypothetical protein HYX16_01580 [Candidatus Woesearchaeota archaeon]|nr:hypothetical protein [Candidatus Woesearchaeota archaeon]
MNKKGQVYLVVSLIIGLIVFVLASRPNILNISSTDDDFKEISENYNQESSRFLNTLIKDSADSLTQEKISGGFSSFTGVFTQYSKSLNPTFGLIYLLNYKGILYIGNYLDKTIVFDSTELPGCMEKINATINYGPGGITDTFDLLEFTECKKEIIPIPKIFTFSIKGEDITYEARVVEGQPEIIIVSRENILGSRKVFVEDQYIKGKRKHNENKNK